MHRFPMINFSTLILSSEVSGPGGLFDFDATLPLVASQFLLLMIILNTILYTPLLTIIEERKEYILTNLGKASDLLAEANKLTTQYEEELDSARKQAQLEIASTQKRNKEFLEIEIQVSQVYIDSVLDNITRDLLSKKDLALKNLDDIVESLCANIETRLSF